MNSTQSMMFLLSTSDSHAKETASAGFTFFEVLTVLVVLGILGTASMISRTGRVSSLPMVHDQLITCQMYARGLALAEGGGICLQPDTTLTLYRTAKKTLTSIQDTLICPGISPDATPPEGMTIASTPEVLCSDALGRVCPEELLQPHPSDAMMLFCPASGDPTMPSALVIIKERTESTRIVINKETGWVE